MNPSRWRLILGEGDAPLEAREAAIDAALAPVYGASLDPSRPALPAELADWLARIRELFPEETVAIVQADAIERRGWNLLAEPETLSRLEPTVDLVRLILEAKDAIPARARDAARAVVRALADRLRARLETGLRASIVGAIRRNRRSPAGDVDWRRTIDRNLRHWQPARRILVPERFHFRVREARRRDWSVILLVDQSGSMAESVIHSSIVASVLASLDVVRTHLLLFDTSVVDLTEHLSDPVDLLFGARLSGGTDIAGAVARASRLVETPERTVFVLVTDLREGGDRAALLARLDALVRGRVKAMCVLALADDGRAAYDAELARDVAAVGVPAFACTPQGLVDAVARALEGRA